MLVISVLSIFPPLYAVSSCKTCADRKRLAHVTKFIPLKFPGREGLVSPPLLIGCGGLAILIYEVPENAEAPVGLSTSYLKLV